MPQLALFHGGDAAAGVPEILRQTLDGVRCVEATARLVGDSPEQGRMHGRVEVLRVAGRGAEMRDRLSERRTGTRCINRDLVRARFVADERAAVLAGALAGPLEWHVHGLAAGTRHVRDDRGVVEFDELAVDDGRFKRDGLAGLDAVGRRVGLDHLRNAIHQRAQKLPPVVLVRLVLDGNAGVHLPQPRVLRGERQGLAAAVAMGGQHRVRAAALVGARDERGRPRLDRGDEVDAGDLRQLVPPLHRGLFRARDLGHSLRVARAGRRDLEPEQLVPAATLERHRQHLRDRRSDVAALPERTRTTDHQETATATIDEVRNHPQLVAGERARLDAAEHEAAVAEQLLARLRKSADQLVLVVDADAQVLVVGRPLQGHELQVLVIGHRAPDELHLEARLALEVQNLLFQVAHVDERLARIVLRDELARLRRHAESEQPRTGIPGRRADANRGGPAVSRQRHFLGTDDVALVFDVHGDRIAGVTGLADDQIDEERRAFQDGPRCADAIDLNVARERLTADADGEDRQLLGLHAEQRFVERLLARVGSVADNHEPGDRKTSQLLPHAVERRPELRLRPGEREIFGRADAAGHR